MENSKVSFVAQGMIVRDLDHLKEYSSALEEVAAPSALGDMLRNDDGTIVKGLFVGVFNGTEIGRTVGMGGKVEAHASDIRFHIVIEADKWKPERWDRFGVDTDLLRGDSWDVEVQEERLAAREAKHSAAAFSSATFTDETPELKS